jgi:hypothetical protein
LIQDRLNCHDHICHEFKRARYKCSYAKLTAEIAVFYALLIMKLVRHFQFGFPFASLAGTTTQEMQTLTLPLIFVHVRIRQICSRFAIKHIPYSFSPKLRCPLTSKIDPGWDPRFLQKETPAHEITWGRTN